MALTELANKGNIYNMDGISWSRLFTMADFGLDSTVMADK